MKKKKSEKKTADLKRKRLLGIKDFIKSASETWTEKTREAPNDQLKAVLMSMKANAWTKRRRGHPPS